MLHANENEFFITAVLLVTPELDTPPLPPIFSWQWHCNPSLASTVNVHLSPFYESTLSSSVIEFHKYCHHDMSRPLVEGG